MILLRPLSSLRTADSPFNNHFDLIVRVLDEITALRRNGTVPRIGGGVVNPKSRVPVKMSVKWRIAALNRKDKAQMIGWALDQISKEAIWALVVVGMIVVVAVVSSFRR